MSFQCATTFGRFLSPKGKLTSLEKSSVVAVRRRIGLAIFHVCLFKEGYSLGCIFRKLLFVAVVMMIVVIVVVMVFFIAMFVPMTVVAMVVVAFSQRHE